MVQAQEAVAAAHESLISSLYLHNLAKVSFARPWTRRRGVREYLKGSNLMVATMESPSSVVTEPNRNRSAAPQAQPSRPSRPQTASLAINGEPSFWAIRAHKWGLILAGLLILVAVFFLCGISRVYESTDDAQIDGT